MMSLRTKLWCAFGGLLLILLAVSVLSVVVLTRYSRALERVFQENYRSAVYCDAMKASLDRLDARARRLVGHDDAPQVPIDAAAERERFEANLELQLRNCTLAGERQLTERAAELWRGYKTHYADFDAAGEGADHSPSRRDLYRRELLPRYEQLKDVAQRVADMNMSNMVSVDGQAKRTLIDVRNAVLVLVAAGTLLAAALVAAVGATILKPLGALTGWARQIGGGDLDLRGDGADGAVGTDGISGTSFRSRDEVGQLVEAFNAMAAKLREFRRLDHERLARTQQTTQLAIDSLPDAVFVIAPDGGIEISNRTAQTHFGIGPGATVARLNLPWLTEIFDAVVKGQKPFEPAGYKSAIRLFSDGEERFLLPHAVPMFDADRRVVGATVILADVTRLRHEDELKTGLVSTVSHELRTPLTSIRMAVLLLLDEKFGALAPKQQRLLAAARDDGDRLYGIIENLLSLARLESGRDPVQPQPTTAGELIAQSLDPLRDAFADRHLRIDEPAAGRDLLVLADPAAVALALNNLLSNALKFTPPGGAVEIAAVEEGAFIGFTVADTGAGIPAEFARRIFDKFFRIPRKPGPANNGTSGGTSPNPAPTGAGLGLAIAKEVIEDHGGRIEFRPREGGGSVFRFTLPRASALREGGREMGVSVELAR